MRLLVYSILFFLVASMPLQGQLSISGMVTGANGEKVVGAEVYLKEPQLLKVTDNNGSFEFKNLSGGKFTLVVFAFEYEVFEKELTFDSSLNVDIRLKELKTEELSEVILTQRREQLFALNQLKKVEGTAIYAGKKSEVVLMDGITGNLAANNARQVYGQVVGLNIYDNGDGGLQLNIGGGEV